MGVYVFKLPDVGEGTVEAEIVAWHVKVGDVIEEDQNLADVLTDKATIELTSPVSGKVISLHGEPGEMAAVGAPLAELEIEGTGHDHVHTKSSAPSVPSKPSAPTQSPVALATEPSKEISKTPGKEPARQGPPAIVARRTGDKPLASPAVRLRAQELGIDLRSVAGSGLAGRISHEDLDGYIAQGGRNTPRTSSYARRDGIEDVKLIGLRRKIAEKMQESKRRIPHYAYVEEIDMTELESLRTHLNETRSAEQPKLNVLPFLMRALVKVLPSYPQINARFHDETGIIHRHAAIHIGIATQTANGLVVPVVKHAEARDLWDCAAEVARVAGLTRDGKATKDDLSGSTITITSLGALGGIATTPVINHPEVAIIGPNAIVVRPVVREGQIAIRKMMNLSSSFDHRVVDGYDAAEFIQKIKGLLEHPATLFMD